MHEAVLVSAAACVLPYLVGCVHAAFSVRFEPEAQRIWPQATVLSDFQRCRLLVCGHLRLTYHYFLCPCFSCLHVAYQSLPAGRLCFLDSAGLQQGNKLHHSEHTTPACTILFPFIGGHISK